MTTRREFLKAAGAASLAIPMNVHARQNNDLLRVGLIGCGGRGTGAATQALAADSNVKLVAMGDAFEDRLKKSLEAIKSDEKVAHKVDVKPDLCFTGFDAYKHVIANSDVVLLTTPPHFRPLQIKAAVDAGKHVFAEKPIAVDAPGVRSVLATCEEAKKKKLAVVSGLCLRYSNSFREAIKRIHGGAIGEILYVQATDLRSGRWAKPRQPEWSDMTYHMRNWYNFTWLSGDFNVEQHVHFLDIAAWAMGRYPDFAVGVGGRQVLVEPEYGNIYDHFSVLYEIENGPKFLSQTRQQGGCKNNMSAEVIGTKGRAFLTEGNNMRITGPEPWEKKDKDNNIYQTEHDEFFASIRAGQPINNGEYQCKSTLVAILGRMAAYTGQQIKWDQAMNSKEDLSPAKYDWDAAVPPHAIAVPGRTKFF
jgi:predicted dehydrogenase